jgi:hypothetical protein
MQTEEWFLTVAVIVVPLIIAVVVTLWSLEQVRYRPKKRRPPRTAPETLASDTLRNGSADTGKERD